MLHIFLVGHLFGVCYVAYLLCWSSVFSMLNMFHFCGMVSFLVCDVELSPADCLLRHVVLLNHLCC